jgi:hypothetical protein
LPHGEDRGLNPAALAAACPPLNKERMREIRAACAVLIRRAILTLAAIPDPDRRFQQSPQSCMPQPVHDAIEAYGYRSARARRFHPTPADLDRYLIVLPWLGWLGRQRGGERDVQILIARAHGCPWWKLSERFNRGDDTLRAWEKGAIATIAYRHWREIERMS